MVFEDSALKRLKRYREEADRSLALMLEAEDAVRDFSERLFSGLEYTAALGRQAGFELEATYTKDLFNLRAMVGQNSEAEVTFGVLRGAAAETDEDLMHEELSRYSLDPSGYSGRILGWSEIVGQEACQTFTVYRDGVWKTKGIFVNLARGKVDDPDEIINGFCLRIIGRLIDLAALTGGAGRFWADESYTLPDLLNNRVFPRTTRWPR